MSTIPLIISNWQSGISPSVVSGEFSDMRCVDIYSEPGLLKAGFIGNKKTGTTVTGLVKWLSLRDGASSVVYAYDSANKLYTAADAGGSWSQVTGNTTTSGSGNGMIVWKGYVITARNTAIDIYNISDASWTNGWGGLTLESDEFHPMLVGQDDILYIGNGRYVASIKENSGSTFDPTKSATYTATAQALDLPSGYRVRCLAEFGTNLMIGTWQGSNIYDKNVADIFPWDRISDSFTLPIRLNENGVLQMINVENTLYIVSGIEHAIYEYTGASAQRILKIPNHLWDLDGGVFTNAYPGAIAQFDGRILTGTAEGTLTGSASPHNGIFSLNPKTGTLLFESQVSAGSDSDISIGSILSTGTGFYLVGWQDRTGSAQGIDLFRADGRHSTAANSFVRSRLYSVGTKISPETYNSLEIQLSDALSSSQSVVVKYRTDTSSSFTTLATFDHTTYGAVKSFNGDIGLIDIENIQIEIQISCLATSNSSPKVIYVKLY